MRADRKEEAGRLKITNQFRSKEARVYDLKCEGSRLTLSIEPRQTPADPGEWRVEARASRDATGDARVMAWGATRIDALRAVGVSWVSRAPSLGLSRFDWVEVERVLGEVRAL